MNIVTSMWEVGTYERTIFLFNKIVLNFEVIIFECVCAELSFGQEEETRGSEWWGEFTGWYNMESVVHTDKTTTKRHVLLC